MHAILVHEGGADSGHYYAFIFDRKAQIWYRFNDYRVSVETEERVMEESFGDLKKKSSAYGLVYVNSDIAKTQE